MLGGSAIVVPLTALAFFTLIGCIVAVWIVRRTGRVLSFQFLVVANYITINLLSGIAHILGLGTRRGYFDAVRILEAQQLGQLVLVQGVGLVGLCAGLLATSSSVETRPNAGNRQLSRFDRALLPLAAGIVLPIALIGLLRITEYASTLEVFGGRIISVGGGMARYVFTSHWLVWAVSFLVIWIAYGPFKWKTGPVLVLSVVAIIVIAAALSWSGGRSITLVFTLPLIMVMLPLFRSSRLVATGAISVGTLALMLYVIRVSDQRFAATRSGAGNIWDWVDWQWGRFSMLGFGVSYVDEKGHLFGETLLGTLGGVVGSLVADSSGSRSSSAIAAAEIFNSSSARFLSLGLSFELYVNLGILGVFAGYFLVGWACRRIDHGYAASGSVISQLLWAYLGTLVVFRLLPSDAFGAIQPLIFSGAPLLVVAALSYVVSGQRSSRRAPHGQMPPQTVKVSEGTGIR